MTTKRKRRTHQPEFKARVAKEAMRGHKTITEIAQENQLHPVQVNTWKKELEDRLVEIFETKKKILGGGYRERAIQPAPSNRPA